jgi:hypothetical protein
MTEHPFELLVTVFDRFEQETHWAALFSLLIDNCRSLGSAQRCSRNQLILVHLAFSSTSPDSVLVLCNERRHSLFSALCCIPKAIPAPNTFEIISSCCQTGYEFSGNEIVQDEMLDVRTIVPSFG